MTEKNKYATGTALRAALEERLKQIAKAEHVELQRLRRQVAFDRFLARLFHRDNEQWVLKGGYAMELRFQIARATKDLDFTVRTISEPVGEAVLGHLQEAGQRDLNDFFAFRVGVPMMDLDGAPYGGSRYPVEAMMAQRTFVKFHLDVGIGEEFQSILTIQHGRPWHVFVSRRGSKAYRLRHDGRYIRRPPVAQHRLARIGNDHVQYLAKDTRNKQLILMKYSNEEFIDLLVQHVPTPRRHAMRHFGLLAPRCKALLWAAVFVLLNQQQRAHPPRLRWRWLLIKIFGTDPLLDSEGQLVRYVGRRAPAPTT